MKRFLFAGSTTDSTVADYHRDHPDQPILGTEMGSTVTTRGIYTKDSIRGYLPDEDLTALVGQYS